MRSGIVRGAMAVVLGTGVLLGGCAHREDELDRARAQAYWARQDAINARINADRARYEADYTARWAHNAAATAYVANERVDLLKERKLGPHVLHKRREAAKKKRASAWFWR